jgi:hypothetical protein
MIDTPEDCVGENRRYPFVVCCTDDPYQTRRNFNRMISTACYLIDDAGTVDISSNYTRGIAEFIAHYFGEQEPMWVMKQIVELVESD